MERSREDILNRTREIYQPETRVEEIDHEEALCLGRGLSELGYRIIGGMAVFSGSKLTVDRALAEIDRSRRYTRSLVNNPSSLVGPRYEQIADNEFCPPGVAIWEPAQK